MQSELRNNNSLKRSLAQNLLRETVVSRPNESLPLWATILHNSNEIETKKNSDVSPKTVWERAVQELVEDFYSRRHEILSLNPGRRLTIESHISALAKLDTPIGLEKILACKVGSSEYSGLYLFLWQAAIFQLFQFLLVKRWSDNKEISLSTFLESSQKLNWLISNHLKENSTNKANRISWSFLKMNIYSWWKPSPETWSKLLLFTETKNLILESEDFLTGVYASLAKNQENGEQAYSSLYSKLGWDLFCQIRCMDECAENIQELRLGRAASNSLLVSGLGGGQSVSSLKNVAPAFHLSGVYFFAIHHFEQFLAEMHFIWAFGTNTVYTPTIQPIDRIQAASKQTIPMKNMPLPIQEAPLPTKFGHALCLPTEQNSTPKELEMAQQALEKIYENGVLVLGTNHFWVTEKDTLAQNMRISCLQNSALRLIIDLRHLHIPENFSIPKSFFVLEKHSSKEIRDSNRPRIIKVRGTITNPEQLEKTWQLILDHLSFGDSPGNVKFHSIENIKLEFMLAATTQNHLNSSPWTSLSEQAFYQISHKLKSYPHKVHQQGFILRPQKTNSMSLQHGIHFYEIPGIALYAMPDGGNSGETSLMSEFPKASAHFFLPEMSAKESTSFFAAMINSSAIQFWYKLECEQNHNNKKSLKSADAILKLMPISRIFSKGCLLPAEILQSNINSNIPQTQAIVQRIFSKPELSLEDSIQLHKIVVDLELTISHHLAIAKEYTKCLFPDLNLTRWSIPDSLPNLEPIHAMKALQHLLQAPIRQHPSIECQFIKNIADFKVSHSKIHIGASHLSEIILFNGSQPMIRMSGPTILIQAAHSAIENRLDRPWSDLSQKITLPIDVKTVQQQLNELIQMISTQLISCRNAIQLNDFIFCNIFGLYSETPTSGDSQIIRSHLSPSNSTIPFKPKQPASLL